MTTPQERITQLVHRAAEQAAPDNLDLWPAVAARLRPHTARVARRRRGLLPLAAALAILVVALAALILNANSGSDPVHVASLGRNLTPTVSPEPRVTPADTLAAFQSTPTPDVESVPPPVFPVEFASALHCRASTAEPGVEVRSVPSRNASTVLGTVAGKTSVEVLERRDLGDTGWFRVRITGNTDVEGWVLTDQLEGFYCDEGNPYTPAPCMAFTQDAALTVRAEPSTGAKALGSVLSGSQMAVRGLDGSWIQVEADLVGASQPETGWVLMERVTVLCDAMFDTVGDVLPCYVTSRLDSIKIRVEPDSDAPAVGTVFNQGAQMEVTERRDVGSMGWYRVHAWVPMPAGYVDGWVRADQVNGPLCGAPSGSATVYTGVTGAGTELVLDVEHVRYQLPIVSVPGQLTVLQFSVTSAPDHSVEARLAYEDGELVAAFDPASVTQITIQFMPRYVDGEPVPISLIMRGELAPDDRVTLTISGISFVIPVTPTPGRAACERYPLYCVPLVGASGGGEEALAGFETPDSRTLDAPSSGAPGVVRGVTAEGAPFIGDPNAPIRFLLFQDLGCPHCQTYHMDDLRRFIEDYVLTGQAVLEMRLINAVDHSGAAAAAYCAGEQGMFWEMADSLFIPVSVSREYQIQTTSESFGLDMDRFNACFLEEKYAAVIDANRRASIDLGVTGVPTVLAKGGALTTWTQVQRDYDTLKTLTESAAREAGLGVSDLLPPGTDAVSVVASDSYDPGAEVDVYVTMAFVNVDDDFQAPTDPGDLPTLEPFIVAAPPSDNTDGVRVVTQRVIERAVVVLSGPLADGSGEFVLTLAVSPQDAVVLAWALDAGLPVSIAPHSGE